MVFERDFGVFDLLLYLKFVVRLIFYEVFILWINNKIILWFNFLFLEDKEKCMVEVRVNISKIMVRYKERREKIFR